MDCILHSLVDGRRMKVTCQTGKWNLIKTMNNTQRILAPIICLIASDVTALDLVEAYSRAQNLDPNWQAQLYAYEAEKQNLGLAKSTLLPTVMLQGAIVRRHQKVEETQNSAATPMPFDMEFIQPNTTTKQISVNVRQPLFRWDLWQSYQQAKTADVLSEVKLAAQRQQHILDVSESYFNVLRQQALIQTFEEEEKALQQQLKTMQAKLKEGLVARSDVSEANAQYQNARANRIAGHVQLDLAKEQLRLFIGEYETELADIKADFEYQAPIPNNVSEWQTLAQTHNLNLQQARFNVQINDQQRAIERSSYYPQVDAVASVGYSSQSPKSAISSNGQFEQVGVEMNWQVFNGGRSQTAVKKATKQLQQSEAQLDAQIRRVSNETRSAFSQLSTDQAKLEARKTAMASSQLVAKASKASYSEGLRSMVDVLLAQRNAFANQQEYVNAQYDYLINVMRLKAAAGILTDKDLREMNMWLEAK